MSKLIKNIIKEEIDNFEWIEDSLNNLEELEGLQLVKYLDEYFKSKNSRFESVVDDGYYLVQDDTGFYVTIRTDELYNLEVLDNYLKKSISRMENRGGSHGDTILEYKELYSVLSPLFKDIE